MYEYREAGCADRRHVSHTGRKIPVTWNISKNMIDIPYFFRRNCDLGTIFVYVGYRDVRCLPPIYVYIGKDIYLSADYYPYPHPSGVIIIQPIFRFLRVIFDGEAIGLSVSARPTAEEAAPEPDSIV